MDTLERLFLAVMGAVIFALLMALLVVITYLFVRSNDAYNACVADGNPKYVCNNYKHSDHNVKVRDSRK